MVDPAGAVAGVVSAILDVSKFLGSPVRRQFMYLYDYSTNIDNLKEKVGKLNEARKRMERRVVDDENNKRIIEDSIKSWGNNVKEIIDNADKLIKEANNLQQNVARDEVKHEDVNLDEANPCFMRFRPNFITRYNLSKEASRKVNIIGKFLAEERDFREISYDTTPQQIWLTSESGYNTFKSRESTLKDILNALNGANRHIIGIYGMGGLGKTTLVKEVGRKAMKDKSFDKVVLVEVTATPDIKKIQRGIAEQLRLTLPDGSESERANRLYEALKNNKKSDKENDKKDDEEKDKPLPQENKKTLGRSLTLGLTLPDGRQKMLHQHEGLENDKKNDAENDKKNEAENDKKTNKESDEKNKKVLIILDNIWEELKLEKIGIPSGADFGESKLLLTTRDRNVLERMGCEPFEIGKLDEKEAWTLFKETAGDFIEQGELKPLSQDVCKKCGGLPIAIVAVAKALSNRRNPSEWEEALVQFKRPSPENFEDDLELAYLSIELSYKSLRGKELKETFLLCSLMGHEGSILDLLKYVMGLNIFEDIYTMQKARDRVCKFTRKLKDSGLLLDGHTSESFSMHDFVREVAISIANRDNCLFCVRNDTDLWEWPHKDRLNICTKIFIRDSAIIELPEGLECPQLQSFFMNTNVSDSRFQISSMLASRLKTTYLSDSQVEIPQNFFIGMTKLKVLDLTGMQLYSLRSSLPLLKDLQTLCLDSCKFEDVAIIGELKCLKILSFRGSNVKQLPEKIAQLTKLRLLDLSFCEQLKVIAPNVISSLFRLEELYISGCFVEWEIEVHNVKRSNASLEELKHLSQLTTLELEIKDGNFLPQGLFSKELKRYKISIGDGSSAFGGPFISGDRWKFMIIKSFSFEEQNTFRTLRTLKLKHNSVICLEELQGFNNVEFLCLDKLEGVQNVLYELNKEGFSQLKHLHVHNNPTLLCIVDTQRYIPRNVFPAFPLLESLILFNLINLETICFDQPKKTSFQNLKFIQVEACGKLKYLFSFSNIAESLPQLQRIDVNDCPNMKEIFVIGSEDNVSNRNVINLCQLRFLSLRFLSKLASFYSEVKTHSTSQPREIESMPLFDEKVVFDKLEVLDLKGLNMEKIWSNQLQTSVSSYQNLTHLTIQDCGKLKYVFPFYMVKRFKELQHLEIWNCKMLEEIVLKGERAKKDAKVEWPMLKKLKVWNCERLDICTSEYKVVFHKLEVLDLKGLNMEKIWNNQLQTSVSSCYQNLTHLTLKDCEKLKYVFPSSMVKCFKNLQHLEIWNCKFLEEIILKGERVKKDAKVKWPMLKKLKVGNCERLHICTSEYKVVFPNLEDLELCGINIEKIWDSQLSTSMSSSCQTLTRLTIKSCEKLKYVFLSSMVESFKQLQHLEIFDCKVLEAIVVKEEEADQATATFEFPKVVFPNLEVLILGKVNIEKIWDNQLSTSMSFSCQTLTRLIIKGCEKLKYVFPSSMVENFKQLQHLEICDCKVLKEIVEKGEGADQAIVKFEFPQVTSLKLQDLPELTGLYPGNHTSKWPVLKDLKVWDCEKLQIFTSEYEVVSPNLEALDLDGINSEKICSNKFDQLQRLEICNCKVLKEIVANAGGAGAVNKLVFSRVTNLILNNLPELTTLNISEWPMLEKLEVYDCVKVKIILDDNKGQIDTSNSQSLGGQIEPHLLKVKLGGIDWQFQFPDNFFSRLKVLKIRDDKSANFPFQRFNNLEKLKCDESSYTEIFFCGEDEKHSVTPTQIKHLELNNLFGLKYMWKQDSKLDSVLQNLEVLKVLGCLKLINLAPTSASFQNLTALELHGCHGLINLITFSTAKSLVQLREMEIKACKMVLEIVANERDAIEDEIVFSKLKLLSLEDLESLTCFCSGNCNFNFPSLEELVVAECPNMKTFSRGDLITPSLLKVKQNSWDEGCWEGELNRTIQRLHREVVSTNAEEWTLSGKDITPIWEGQFPENFCELKVLKIIKDESENIPIGIFNRFNNLENLVLKVSSYKEIFSCGKDEKYAGMLTQIKVLELWGLFNLKYMWKRDSQLDSIIQNLEILKLIHCHNLITLVPSSAYFGNLTTLEICCCDGLINLVSSSTAKSLVRLEKMTVEMCEMMTEVVASEGEVAEDEIVFSKLTSLTLESLDSLTCFYPGNYSFKFPSLDELNVGKCPKMKIFSGGELSAPKLEEVWHYQTSDECKDCWEGDLNTTIQHLHKKVNQTVLVVENCDRMLNLITSSTAKILTQLREMTIEKCRTMMEIVENEGGVEKDEIVFSNLKSLSLIDLDNLICFYSGNCTFNFQSLEKLIVRECPMVMTFSRRILSAPKLQYVIQELWDEDEEHWKEEGCWERDVNTFIQELHKKLVDSDLDELTIIEKDITSMWEGQIPKTFTK